MGTHIVFAIQAKQHNFLDLDLGSWSAVTFLDAQARPVFFDLALLKMPQELPYTS